MPSLHASLPTPTKLTQDWLLSAVVLLPTCHTYLTHCTARRYDAMDLVAHLYRQLRTDGYRGVAVHALYRDEVQDFTQGELALDLRVVTDPNALFYCGGCFDVF